MIVPIVDAGSTPAYLEIGAKAAHLRDLGMSDRAIPRAIGVSDKTVAKSLQRRQVDACHDFTDAIVVSREMTTDLAGESSADRASRPR